VRLLILGLSNLVRRRVLPALESMQGLEGVDIASRDGVGGWEQPDWLGGETFSSYEAALEQSSAEVVYVSLVNSEQGRWATAALENDRHVVVDKPAFLGLAEMERALERAAKHNVCLAEATVWAYHPQVDLMKAAFEESGSLPTRISAAFSVPPLDPGNFRYCRSLGGGSLWDQGPYAVSVGRVFFGGAPDTVDCQVLSSGGEDNVDTGFSMLATYAGGRSVVGHFGFDTAYRNHLDILGGTVVVEADRVFTTPADAENEIRISSADGPTVKTAPAANPFGSFFERVSGAIAQHDWHELTEDLVADAHALQRLRDAAGVV
jgi:NDP-hexose-3-ketoreductase